MTTTTPTIEIPRLDNEPPRAYAARVEYVTMGAQRSTAKVGQRLGKSKDLIDRWSSAYGWQEHARQYDQTLATLAAQRHAEEYQRELEAHRRKVLEKSASLSKLLDGLERQILTALVGQVIEGKDDKIYYIPKMDIEISALTALIRGRLIVADLEAHALDIPTLRAALERAGGDA